MPAARVRNANFSSNHHPDPDLDLTPRQRLQALAALLAIGLQRLRERPRDAPDSGPLLAANSAREESSEFCTNELA